MPTAPAYPMEPQAASAGGVVFYSGNNDAAYSLDNGGTWTFVEPDAMFGKADGGYYGDSQVRYAPKIDSFIWLMQYGCTGKIADCSNPAATHANRYRLAVATPAAIRANVKTPGRAWKVWSLQSVKTFQSSGWFDYPDMSVGKNKLYLTWDEICTGCGVINARTDLAQLKAGGTIGIQYWRYAKSIFWRVAQNASARGYYISNAIASDGASTDVGRALAYTWDDTSGLVVEHDLDHTALPLGAYKLTDPLGETTWCRFCDARVGSATLRGNELWVAWTAASDTTFPNPHIQIEIFDSTSYALLRDQAVWSRKYSMVYPALNVNADRDVGLAYSYGGATQNPSPAAGFLTPSHDLVAVAQADKVTGQGQGDYSSIEPAYPGGSQFVVAGYIARLGPPAQNRWRFMRFGRS